MHFMCIKGLLHFHFGIKVEEINTCGGKPCAVNKNALYNNLNCRHYRLVLALICVAVSIYIIASQLLKTIN